MRILKNLFAIFFGLTMLFDSSSLILAQELTPEQRKNLEDAVDSLQQEIVFARERLVDLVDDLPVLDARITDLKSAGVSWWLLPVRLGVEISNSIGINADEASIDQLEIVKENIIKDQIPRLQARIQELVDQRNAILSELGRPTETTSGTIGPNRLIVPIPGVEGQDLRETTSLGQYVRAFYYFGIVIASIFAVASIVYAGIVITTSSGNAAKVSDAKDIIRESILGILLLLGAVLVLNTVNPGLLNARVTNPADAPTRRFVLSQADRYTKEDEIGQLLYKVWELQRNHIRDSDPLILDFTDEIGRLKTEVIDDLKDSIATWETSLVNDPRRIVLAEAERELANWEALKNNIESKAADLLINITSMKFAPKATLDPFGDELNNQINSLNTLIAELNNLGALRYQVQHRSRVFDWKQKAKDASFKANEQAINAYLADIKAKEEEQEKFCRPILIKVVSEFSSETGIDLRIYENYWDWIKQPVPSSAKNNLANFYDIVLPIKDKFKARAPATCKGWIY